MLACFDLEEGRVRRSLLHEEVVTARLLLSEVQTPPPGLGARGRHPIAPSDPQGCRVPIALLLGKCYSTRLRHNGLLHGAEGPRSFFLGLPDPPGVCLLGAGTL